MKEIILKTVSCMEKVLTNGNCCGKETFNVMAKNERFSFQIAIKSKTRKLYCGVKLDGALSKFATVKKVDNVPVGVAVEDDFDKYIISKKSGLYPDLLRPLEERDLTLPANTWVSLFVSIQGEQLPVGINKLDITLTDNEGVVLGKCDYSIEVLDYLLPELDMFYSNWFHYDCIADYYGLELFDEKYYQTLNKFLRSQIDAGINVIFTPIFTPPLDTEIGKERRTTQLIDVEKIENDYQFNFDKIDYFMDNALKLGFKYFEFSHLFSQWGAKACPKVLVKENGVMKKYFGWDCSSEDEEYIFFLKSFLGEFTKHLQEKGLKNKCYFHLSDEAKKPDLPRYKKLKNLLKDSFNGFEVVDALSDFDYYQEDRIGTPVVFVNKIKPFIESKIYPVAYYCCESCKYSQKYLTNRYIVMPSLRTRVLGVQLYLNNCVGFLQWGYNFYYSQLSKTKINPFLVTDAGGTFPSGDAYIVYPGVDGPLLSLRYEILINAFQDYRLFKLLESVKGKDIATKLLEKFGFKLFDKYPKSIKKFSLLRKKVFDLLQ